MTLLLDAWCAACDVHEPDLRAGAQHPQWQGPCPGCGGVDRLGVAYRPHPRGQGNWLMAHCRQCEAKLADVCEALGIPEWLTHERDPAGDWDALVGQPWAGAGSRWSAAGEDPRPAPLPGRASIDGWCSRLLSERAALRYLQRERGLTLETIRLRRLGYDGSAITLPVYADGNLVNLRRRFWPEPLAGPHGPIKMLGLRGRPAALYPGVPAGASVLLCAGEFDALVALQRGLPAVSTTCGASLPTALVLALLPNGGAGRRVAVAYDVGEDAAAARTVARLRESGAEAWAVDLGAAWLKSKEDLTDWFVTYGRSARRLLHLIRAARRAA